MLFESLTSKVKIAKEQGSKTLDIALSLSRKEKCLSLILYSTHFVSIFSNFVTSSMYKFCKFKDLKGNSLYVSLRLNFLREELTKLGNIS